MRNIALFLTYLGTDYHGWQVQKNLPTVAETVEKAAQIYLLTASLPRVNTITDEQLRDVATQWKKNYRKDFLNL